MSAEWSTDWDSIWFDNDQLGWDTFSDPELRQVGRGCYYVNCVVDNYWIEGVAAKTTLQSSLEFIHKTLTNWGVANIKLRVREDEETAHLHTRWSKNFVVEFDANSYTTGAS